MDFGPFALRCLGQACQAASDRLAVRVQLPEAEPTIQSRDGDEDRSTRTTGGTQPRRRLAKREESVAQQGVAASLGRCQDYQPCQERGGRPFAQVGARGEMRTETPLPQKVAHGMAQFAIVGREPDFSPSKELDGSPSRSVQCRDLYDTAFDRAW
jgi:hypothetical protein